MSPIGVSYLILFTRFVRINIAIVIFVSAAMADVPEELRNMVLTGDMMDAPVSTLRRMQTSVFSGA